MLASHKERCSPAAHTGTTLGQLIAAYRQRRRRAHQNERWSQEDLAFASGTDQAHISRIESDHRHPEYSTLTRICDALELTQMERAHLMAVAGYQMATPLPTRDEALAIIERLAPVLDSYSHPVSLMDEGERIWHQNELGDILWRPAHGTKSRAEWERRQRGFRVIEAIFDPAVYGTAFPRWCSFYENAEYMLTRTMLLFWRAFQVRLTDPDMVRTLDCVRENPDFLRRWREVEQGTDDFLFLDHATYDLRHETLGALRVQSWRTRVMVDERFFVSHVAPADPATGRILERLRETRVPTSTSSLARPPARL